MDEKHERSEKNTTGRSLRPKSAGHVWAWIVLAVGTVLCMTITLWVVEAGDTTVVEFSDREIVHRVAGRLQARWPQAPGPPEAYREEAQHHMSTGEIGEALRLMSMSLALDPDDVDSWVEMICMSCIQPHSALALSEDERQVLTQALMDIEEVPTGRQALVAQQAGGGVGGAVFPRSDGKPPECLKAELRAVDPKTKPGTLDTLDVLP